MGDRLTPTRALESSGLQSAAAERVATEIYEAIHDNVAIKADLRELEQRLDLRFEQLERRIDGVERQADLRAEGLEGRIDGVEHRLIARLGGLIVAIAGLLFAALHYWPPHP
ncbi:MAG: hypothetical protein ACREFH_03995 [Stellaceae bacterium]